MKQSRLLFAAALAAYTALGAAPVVAQRANNDRAIDDRANFSRGSAPALTFPGVDPMVQITAQAPEEARVGQSFDFQIQVKNVSQNIAVHDLVIAQHGSQQFDIQSSRIERPRNEIAQQKLRSQKQPGQEQQEQEPQEQEPQEQEPQEQEPQGQQPSQEQQAQSGDGQAPQGQDKSRWTIPKLMPGETWTIHVTAVSDREGDRGVCLAVESYKPALCLSTKFTKPELEIVKKAPETADICQIIEYEYYIKNGGTGDLEQFTVEDELPEGIKSIEGHDRLKFTLEDGLKAGDVRKFVARLIAARTGEFSSRAEVRGPDGVSARSNNVTTKVIKPELAVSIEGPSVREVDGLANYTIRVSNRGESPAPSTQLTLHYPRSADLVRAGQPRASSQAASSGANQQAASGQQQDSLQSQPTAGQEQDQTQQRQQAQNQPRGQQTHNQQQGQQRDRQNLARRQWDLGTLRPGQTVELTYALRPFEGGELKQIAVAEYVCEMAQERELAKDMFQAQDSLLTEIIALPGLRLTVVDDKDPVPTGENVTYTIKVANEGNAEASNIQVSAKLPEQLEFVEADGDTGAKNAQGEVTFEPVQTLQPGESSTWRLMVKVNEQADRPIQVEMTAADLKQPVNAEEPTTFFSKDQTQRKEPKQEKPEEEKPDAEKQEPQDDQQSPEPKSDE